MSDDILIEVDHVSKKFCRGLKRAMWYGVRDIGTELFGRSGHHDQLRPCEFWAVEDVSFQLQRGECLGLIGHNGAGKTTLLKMLNGLIKPDRGKITIRGRVGAMIALGAGFNPILTGRENIYNNAAVMGFSKREVDRRFDAIVAFAELDGGAIEAPVQSYSSGMLVRLGFAVAAHCRPDLMFLDEVLAVGDVAFQAKCLNKLGEFRDNGTAFILVSHNLHQISRFANRSLYLNHGRPVFLGSTADAVVAYTVEMLSAESSMSEADVVTPAGCTLGTGRVRIANVYWMDDRGNRVSSIASGDAIRLCVDYDTMGRAVSNPVLDVVIRDGDGTLFQGTNATFKKELGELRGTGTIVVRFGAMPSNNQVLRFYVTLWNSTLTELFDWKRNLPVTVTGNPCSTGRLLLECDWTVTSRPGRLAHGGLIHAAHPDHREGGREVGSLN